ncbi:MAG: class I SAM-dependent methyltransferase [Candidatus Delongbacteria bacterium]|nr:class I SAM-dependent methyltransferase [Candidatus Delongbacteria bacterium]
MNQGIVKILWYKEVVKSEIFDELEKYSDEFIRLQERLFPEFSKKWVKDSFHQWSRQYEYPFVADALNRNFHGQGRILDAGSGITFFPYYLKEKFPDAEIECCDYDPALSDQYSRVNSEKNTGVNYFTADIKNIERSEGHYSLIYCISVLEHTDDYEAVVKELARITKPGGHLILTFDISIDGSADIPLEKAVRLLGSIEKYYIQEGGSFSISPDEIMKSDTLTTKYMWDTNRKLLPWRYPRLMFFKSLSKGHIPTYFIRNLACYCGIFKKK